MSESLFLIKLLAAPATLLKKETLAQVFSCEFWEISKSTFFTKHLWTTASKISLHQFVPVDISKIFEREVRLNDMVRSVWRSAIML